MAIRLADRLFLSFLLKVDLAMDVEKALPRRIRKRLVPETEVVRPNQYEGFKGLVQSLHLCKGSPRSVEAEQGKCKLIHLQQERIKLRYLILLVILVIISIIFVVLPFIFGRSPYGSRNNWSCPVGHNFAVNWRIRVTFKVHVIWFRVCQDTLSLEKTWVGSQSAPR